MEKHKLLKQYFGHSAFRPGQESLIDALLAGQDVLGVMPTGAGKSVCYQIPALMLPGITLVISPLIALMKDQVAALTQVGIPSAYLNSSLTPAQYRTAFDRAQTGAYKIIYVAPERLISRDFLALARAAEISLVAVDEAHCVSQWGQDFRPGYLEIADFVDGLPTRPPVGAFTATATSRVKTDIEKLLLLRNPLVVATGFDRPNLYFEVARPRNKQSYLRAFLTEQEGRSGIVYCATRKNVEFVCEKLRQHGVCATRYHAGLPDEERRRNQDDFICDRARVMVATNAFGMGIDKSNIGFVAHYNMPKDLESYYQEAGRAGRDGTAAQCVLLYSVADVKTARFLLESGESREALDPATRNLVRRRDLERLGRMEAYCKTTGCLRSFLMDYFGSEASPSCGNCGNCKGDFVKTDITLEAQKILSAVARVEKRYSSGLGLGLIIRMLHGSQERRVVQLGLDQLPAYGLLHDLERARIRLYVDHLLEEGYLVLSGGEYPVLRLTERADAVLFRGEQVTITVRKASDVKTARFRKTAKGALPQADEPLFDALKALRTRLAQSQNMPAYIVFSNATLADMAARRPISMTDLLQVSGVGEVKAARYGPEFLAEIRRVESENMVISKNKN